MFTAAAVIRQYNMEHARRDEEETQSTELAAYIAEIGLTLADSGSAFNPINFMQKAMMFAARKIATYIIKKVIKGIIKNIVKTSVRLFWNITRMAAVGLMRYVAVPILHGAMALLVNPATLLVLSTAGLGYAAWRFLIPDSLKKNIASSLENISSPLTDLFEKAYTKSTGKSVYSSDKEKQTKTAAVRKAYKAPDLSKVKAAGKPTSLPNDIEGYVQEAAQEVGIPVNDLRGLIYFESGGNTDAQSPTGALGIGQFITSTWNSFARKYPQYASWGLLPTATPHCYSDDPRRNPRASAIASALFIMENMNAGYTDPFDSYLIYNLGPETAKKLLKGEPLNAADWRRINNQFGSEAARIAKVGSDSAEDFLVYWRNLYYGKYKQVNQNAPAAASKEPSVVVLPPKKATPAGDYFNIVQLPKSNIFMKAS